MALPPYSAPPAHRPRRRWDVVRCVKPSCLRALRVCTIPGGIENGHSQCLLHRLLSAGDGRHNARLQQRSAAARRFGPNPKPKTESIAPQFVDVDTEDVKLRMIAAFSPHKGPFFSANIVKPDLCARTPHAVNNAASNAIDIHAGTARFGSARRLCSSWRRRATSARIWCTRGPRKSGSTISRSSPSPHRRCAPLAPVATVTAPCGMRPCSAAHAAGPFRGSADYSRHCAVPHRSGPMVRSFGAHSNVRFGRNRQHAHLRRGLPCGLHCHCHMRLGRGARTDLPAQHATCSVQRCALLRGTFRRTNGMTSQADSVAPCAFRYGYTFLVPALGWVVCKYILSIPLELMTLLTLYGYSLVTFLPSAVRPAASHRIASHRPHPVGVSRCWHRQERSWRVRFCPPARREYSSTLFRRPAVSTLLPFPARRPARS